MRVTGGTLGGRRLHAPTAGVRPSSDRLRESLFAVLGNLEDAAVLDLYAGAGTLGIEAVSRGASEVVFVERAPRSVAALVKNLEALALEDRCRVLREDSVRAVRRLAQQGRRFDLVLIDPPYASGEDRRALEAIVAAGILAPQGIVVVERSRRHPLERVEGLEQIDERRYGDTVVDRFSASLETSGETLGAGGAPSGVRGADGDRGVQNAGGREAGKNGDGREAGQNGDGREAGQDGFGGEERR